MTTQVVTLYQRIPDPNARPHTFRQRTAIAPGGTSGIAKSTAGQAHDVLEGVLNQLF